MIKVKTYAYFKTKKSLKTCKNGSEETDEVPG